MTYAVILSGGWGRRFWPKSRKTLPKQLLPLGTKYSSLQNLFSIISQQIPKERIWIVTNRRYADKLRKQLPSLPKANLLIEPLARNTAAAIGWASVVIKRKDPQAVSVVLSSDHVIAKQSRFLKAIKAACRMAQESQTLITIGIRPDRPAQEYGYLRLAPNSQFRILNNKLYRVEKFVEKPHLSLAKKYFRSKHYLWNSGIFIWQVESILKAIKRYLPQTYAGLKRIERLQNKPGYGKKLIKVYRRFKDVSIDYGVMEKAKNIYTVEGDFPWQDLGSWINLAQSSLHPNKKGNFIWGLHQGIDTRDSIVFSENNHLIGTVGIKDLIVVHTPTATLVCKKDRYQDVKELTKILEKDKYLKTYL